MAVKVSHAKARGSLLYYNTIKKLPIVKDMVGLFLHQTQKNQLDCILSVLDEEGINITSWITKLVDNGGFGILK
jgi:hypothetical protein